MLDPVSQWLLFGICVGLVICAFLIASRGQRATFLSPLVFVVTLFVFAYGIRAILSFNDAGRYGVFSEFYNANDLGTFVIAYGVFVVGTLSLIAGYASRSYQLIDRVLPSLTITSTGRVYWVSILLLLLSFATFASLIPELISAGAVFGLFERSSRLALTAAWQGRGPMLFLILQGTLFLMCLLYAVTLRGLRVSQLALVLVAALAITACYAFMGSRQGVLGVLLALLLSYHYRIRNIPLGLQAMFGTAAVIAGGLLGLILDQQFGDPQGAGEGGWLLGAFIRFGATFDQFDMLSAYVQKSEEFFFGLPLIEDLLLTYLPREVFPFKPEVFGTVRLQNALFPHLYDYAGLSATYPIGFFGEAYANLHLAGVVLFPFFFGALLRALVHRASSENKSMYIVVVIALLATGPGLVRSYGGVLLSVVLTVGMLKVLFCLPLGERRIPLDLAAPRL
jgi:oligosaccharide repeat unit polymerase